MKKKFKKFEIKEIHKVMGGNAITSVSLDHGDDGGGPPDGFLK